MASTQTYFRVTIRTAACFALLWFMAFNALLVSLGYRCKIKQTGIHTWSECWTIFETKNKKKKVIVFKVDNTFDIVSWYRPNRKRTYAQWLRDIGSGSTIKWYNQKARSPRIIEKIKGIQVSKTASARINRLIKEWFQL